jgi:putative tricarboxylic transport membrane protein
MLDLFSNLWLGLGVALLPANLLACLVGAVLGTLIGVLPGLGPTATIAMLMPITFGLPVETSIIMLAGIYYGASYGGSTTAILVNLPGEAASVVTALDGYQMARQGQAGAALAVAAVGSFIAGSFGTLVVAAMSPLLTKVALSFGPPEYFSMMVLGLLMSVILSHGSFLKSVVMILVGLAIGTVGTDINTGVTRFTFGIDGVIDGIDFVTVAMGLFGVTEIIRNLEERQRDGELELAEIASLVPSREQIRESIGPIIRGSLLGSALGILPGAGPTLAAFAAYVVEKKVSRHPEKFGKGAIAGVAAPESANNAASQTSFIPLLTLGLPTNSVMALMIGALIVQGVQPGPLVITSQPQLFWGLIASMWVGNLLLVIINLPMIGIWVRLLRAPNHYLYPVILLFCAIGAYSLKNNALDVMLMCAFGFLGYFFLRSGFEPAPLILGFVLGPMMEENLRRAMTMSFGDPTTFVTRPISLGILVFTAAAVMLMTLPSLRKKRDVAFEE